MECRNVGVYPTCRVRSPLITPEPNPGSLIQEAPMRQRISSAALLAFSFCLMRAWAATLGNVHGIVHDPQHRPIAGAAVTLHAQASNWSATRNSDGEFQFD